MRDKIIRLVVQGVTNPVLLREKLDMWVKPSVKEIADILASITPEERLRAIEAITEDQRGTRWKK